jgi:hypothetical protein
VRSYLGQIATRSFVPNNFVSTNKQSMSRSRHLCQQAVTSLQIVVSNFYVPETGGNLGVEMAPGSTATVTASIEYPAGTFTQVTFGGSASGTVPDGGVLFSDFVSVTIPQGATFYVRQYITTAAGMVYSDNGSIDYTNGDGFKFGASGIADQTMGGTVTHNDNFNGFFPLAILGTTNRASVAIIGDSRAYGYQDIYSDTSGDRGELARSIGPSLAYMSLTTPSDKAALWVASHTNRLQIAKYCSHAVIQLGINDISGGRTASQLIADYATIAGLIGKPIFCCTLAPRSNSTDSWQTVANQTAFAQEAQRSSFNTSVRAGLSGFAGYFEIADQVESARNSGKWRADTVRTVTDFAINSGSQTLTSATAAFTAADQYKTVAVAGAGAAGAFLAANIITVVNSTTVTLGTNASTTVSGASGGIGIQSGDGIHEFNLAHREIRDSGAVNPAVFVR